MYIKPRVSSIPIEKLEEIIVAGACSLYGYVCINPSLFTCDTANFSSSCSTYDSSACDPLAAPSAGHGNYPT